MTSNTPVNPAAYPALSDADFLKLIFTEEDRLPREFAEEAASRGRRLVPALAEILKAEKNWTAGPPGWWAVVHAAFLLGAIGGEGAVEPLTQALLYGSRYDIDWITEELPSIFGCLGPAAVQPLKKLVMDGSWDWYIRTRALCGLAAVTLKHPQYDEEVFSLIAAAVADKDEDEDTRGHAALILMDFLREEYRPLLLSAASSAPSRHRIYDEEDVNRAFLKGEKGLYWYTRNWLDFYSPEKVSERARRWREEEKETGEDDFEDTEQPLISRRAALEHLGPRAALASKVRETIGLLERGLARPELKTQYDLAMETQRAVDAMFDEDDNRLEALYEQRKTPPASAEDARQAEITRLDPFTIFDIAVGSGRLAEWLVKLTFELGDKGQAREAAALCKAWGEITDPEIFLANRGLMLAKAGLTDEARAQIKDTLGYYDYDKWVNIKAGATLEELGDLAAAEVLYRKALELAGKDEAGRMDALEYLVPLLRRLGKNAEAAGLEDELPPEPFFAPPPWPETVRHEKRAPGRNDPCHCGSGKKYKKCCLGKDGA